VISDATEIRERVLVTGHNGYIGSVLVPTLIDAGYDVVGLDYGYFDECTLIPNKATVPSIRRDIRNLQSGDLDGIDAVIHLAALSNDAVGDLKKNWTETINYDGTVRLAKLAKSSGVKRFIFSSSCIMYGMSEAALVNEDSPLAPETIYAESKVKSEFKISGMASDGFSPTFMRNGTVYGLSPRMRLDTVLNGFVAAAVANRKIVIFSDGSPWRPVVHVEDVARSFLHVLRAPIETVHNQAFNNGDNSLNHQIRKLGEIVADIVPGTELIVKAEPGADQRTYKADFQKFAHTFPDFKFQWNVHDGAKGLYEAYKSINFGKEDFEGNRFVRVRWLKHLLENKKLDDQLCWRSNFK